MGQLKHFKHPLNNTECCVWTILLYYGPGELYFIIFYCPFIKRVKFVETLTKYGHFKFYETAFSILFSQYPVH